MSTNTYPTTRTFNDYIDEVWAMRETFYQDWHNALADSKQQLQAIGIDATDDDLVEGIIHFTDHPNTSQKEALWRIGTIPFDGTFDDLSDYTFTPQGLDKAFWQLAVDHHEEQLINYCQARLHGSVDPAPIAAPKIQAVEGHVANLGDLYDHWEQRLDDEINNNADWLDAALHGDTYSDDPIENFVAYVALNCDDVETGCSVEHYMGLMGWVAYDDSGCPPIEVDPPCTMSSNPEGAWRMVREAALHACGEDLYEHVHNQLANQ